MDCDNGGLVPSPFNSVHCDLAQLNKIVDGQSASCRYFRLVPPRDIRRGFCLQLLPHNPLITLVGG